MNTPKINNLYYLFHKYANEDISTDTVYNFKTIPGILDKLDGEVFDETYHIENRLSAFEEVIDHITAILAIYNPEHIPYMLSFSKDEALDDELPLSDDEDDLDDPDGAINALMCDCYRFINGIRILLTLYPADRLIDDCLNIGWEETRHDDPDGRTADDAIAELQYIIDEIREKDKYTKEFIKTKLEPLYSYFDNTTMDLFE